MPRARGTLESRPVGGRPGGQLRAPQRGPQLLLTRTGPGSPGLSCHHWFRVLICSVWDFAMRPRSTGAPGRGHLPIPTGGPRGPAFPSLGQAPLPLGCLGLESVFALSPAAVTASEA